MRGHDIADQTDVRKFVRLGVETDKPLFIPRPALGTGQERPYELL